MKLTSNDNRNVIAHLAKSSVKINRLRNFFAVFAITLAVSLMTVMILFTSAMEVAGKRQVSKMQQVIYEAIEEDKALDMAKEKDVSELVLMKSGIGIEFGNKIIQPMWVENTPTKGKAGIIQTSTIKKGGSLPKGLTEAAVTEALCELMGVEPEIGNTINITSLDGTTEELVITAFLEGDWNNSATLPVMFSEEYADNGAAMKAVPYKALVNLENGQSMHVDQFKSRVVELGNDYDVKRKDVNYNNYFLGTLEGDSMLLQQRVMAAGVSVGVLFVSILVIYSVFYLSVIGRIRQFGQLRTIGMTRKQIRKMVKKEGLLLSAVGIPLGLLIGGLISFFLKKEGWDWIRTLIILIGVVAAALITVLVSIAKPASLASNISPIEAAKFTGDIEKKKGKKKGKTKEVKSSKKLQRNMTALGLARISAGRSRKKTFLTVLSLGVGGVLFMVAATFVMSTSLEEYSEQGAFSWGQFSMELSSNAAETNEHGFSGIMMNNPLNEDMKNRIMEIDGVEKVNIFTKMEMQWDAKGENLTDSVHPFDKEEFGKIKEKYVSKDSPLRDMSYEELVDNQQIILNGNDTVEEIFGWKFEVGDKVAMTFDNGTELIEKEYTIAGFIDDWRYQDEAYGIDWFCMPETAVKEVSGDLILNDSFIIQAEESKLAEIEPQIAQLVSESSEINLYTLRERKIQDEKSFTMIYSVIIGLSVFIIGFSMLNLINTLITNVVTRKKEFAMMQSVGMTGSQLRKMVVMEGLLLTGSNAVVTLIFGAAAGYGVIQLMRELAATYMHYKFPIWFYLGYMAVLIIVPLIVSGVTLKSFEKQALTERMREED